MMIINSYRQRMIDKMTNGLMEMKDVIKSRRLELGLTQQELADLCHADRTTIVKWESGDIVNIKRDKLKLLSKALNISHLAIMGAEEYITCELDEISIYDAIYGDKLGNQVAKIKNPYPQMKGQFIGIKMAHPTFINSECYAIFDKKAKINSGDIVAVSLNENKAIIRKLYLVDKDIVTLRPVLEDGDILTLVEDQIKNMNIIGKYCYAISPFLNQ